MSFKIIKVFLLKSQWIMVILSREIGTPAKPEA